MITYQQLSTLDTEPLDAAAEHYCSAGKTLRRASTSYQGQVVAPIDSKQVWRGNGRGHAETVVRVERLAFSTAGARLRTVASCLDTLQGELRAAKRALTATVDSARAADFQVTEEGRVTKNPALHHSAPNPYSGGVDWTSTHYDQEAAKHQARIDLQLRRARRADSTCKKLLETVVGAEFVTTSTAQPGVLERARDANGTARDAEVFAFLLGDILRAVYDHDVRGGGNKEFGAIDSTLGAAKGFLEGARDTGASYLDVLLLLGFAASGDAAAGQALKSIPASVQKQLSSLDGWKDLVNWKDLEEGRPGEFAGNLLFALALRKIPLPKLRPGRHHISDGHGNADPDRKPFVLHADNASEIIEHPRFGKYYKVETRARGSHWITRDNGTHHADSWFKVYTIKDGELVHKFDCDEYGDAMPNKHKGPVGKRIPLKEFHRIK